MAAQRSKVAKFSNETRAKLKQELQTNASEYLAAAALLPDDPNFAQVQKLAAERKLRPRYLLTARQYLTRTPEHPFYARWRELAAAGDQEGIRKYYGDVFTRSAAALTAAKAKDPKATAPVEPDLAEAHAALNDVAGLLVIPDKDADAFDGEMLATSEVMKDDLMSLEDKTPDPPSLMGVRDGAITKTLPIHIRGSYLTLGAEVERGFPEVMRTSFTKPILSAKQSGRLELARWMASSEHPLTARVMVNRLWRWHFGRGLVGSTDNFGILGDKPSHPALLDWLARCFIESGWSIKDMHRVLMKSSAYQMASTHPVQASPLRVWFPPCSTRKTSSYGAPMCSVWRPSRYTTPCSLPAAPSLPRSVARPCRCATGSSSSTTRPKTPPSTRLCGAPSTSPSSGTTSSIYWSSSTTRIPPCPPAAAMPPWWPRKRLS